ncbi:hypothetical protein EJB05_30902, partial [Eragrostis curvula]
MVCGTPANFSRRRSGCSNPKSAAMNRSKDKEDTTFTASVEYLSLEAKYFPQGNQLDTVVAGEASPTWRAIEYGLELLKKGTIYRVGNEPGISLGRQDHRKVSAWVKPPGGVLKVNVDGAFHGQSGRAAVGVIARDHDGRALLRAWRLLFHCRDAEEAEAAACLEGVRLSTRWPDASCVLESDCSAVVEKVNMKTPDRSIVSAIIGDIQSEMWQFRAFRVCKVRREQNKVAHELAQWAIKSSSSKVSFVNFPECVESLISEESGTLLGCNGVT